MDDLHRRTLGIFEALFNSLGFVTRDMLGIEYDHLIGFTVLPIGVLAINQILTSTSSANTDNINAIPSIGLLILIAYLAYHVYVSGDRMSSVFRGGGEKFFGKFKNIMNNSLKPIKKKKKIEISTQLVKFIEELSKISGQVNMQKINEKLKKFNALSVFLNKIKLENLTLNEPELTAAKNELNAVNTKGERSSASTRRNSRSPVNKHGGRSRKSRKSRKSRRSAA